MKYLARTVYSRRSKIIPHAPTDQSSTQLHGVLPTDRYYNNLHRSDVYSRFPLKRYLNGYPQGNTEHGTSC